MLRLASSKSEPCAHDVSRANFLGEPRQIAAVVKAALGED